MSRKQKDDYDDEPPEDECPGCPECICRLCGGFVGALLSACENPVFKCIKCGYQPPEANR